MANAKFILTCLFLFVLLFSHKTTCVEGRRLRKMKLTKRSGGIAKENQHVRVMMRQSDPHSSSYLHHGITTMDGFVDAFRPTDPGHSPGIGHSLRN
uniref:Uncharacterized protein n=1 Tax=Nelumbo nucifera TaxID=4432 RepID=A0A822ZDV9_NELNU|nr:TPA_asm: hypothetical protein HUJ06_015529 [Nelumbo nucifera]